MLIAFLPPSKHGSSVREKELERAQIKAHAARFSHQKRNWIKVHKQLEIQEGALRAREQRRHDDRHEYHELILLINNFHGSSDPFNAYPVKITPEINRIISYAKDV